MYRALDSHFLTASVRPTSRHFYVLGETANEQFR